MVDDRPDDPGSSLGGNRQRRAPPTIDLEATDVSGDAAAAGSEDPRTESDTSPSPPRSSVFRNQVLVSAVAGAVAAVAVIGGAWFVGWSVSPFAPAPQANATAIDDLASRMARIESGSGKSQPLSSAATTRFDALEASIASLRRDLAAAHGQSEKLATTVKDLQSAPRTASAAPDLSAITQRLDQIESSAKTLAADTAKHDAPPADETALRRVIAATLLNVSAQHGEPYAEVLAASKALITDPETLKPMDAFASSGVPTANALCRELLAIVPKLAPAPAVSTTGTGIVDRLQEGAARLVRIERTDATEGNSANAVVARITAAALHNDVARARHELDELSPSDRAAAQPWIAKVDARDAALATSHQFAAGAMAAMTKPAK